MKAIACITLATGLLAAGCIFSSSDRDEKDARPRITSISLAEGERVAGDDLAISWSGNAAARLFRYELDGDASAWSESTSVHYSGLMEGPHLFTVTAKRDTIIGEPMMRHFTIDVLNEPAVVFSQRRLTGITSVSVGIEGADSLMAAHIEIVCEEGSARIFEFTAEESGDGRRVVMSDLSKPDRLVLDVGLTGPGNGEGILTIGAMLVQPVKTGGRIIVDSGTSVFRDFNNATIIINGFDEIHIGK